MTTRRGFFSALSAMIAGATLDPEKLLWEPGKIFYSIPARCPGNTLISPEQISREFLEALSRNLDMRIGEFYHQFPSKIGHTITVRRPLLRFPNRKIIPVKTAIFS